MKLVQIGLTDITQYINQSSYKMNSEAQYESWQDGNFVEHRVYIRKRIKGSFDVALYGKNGMDTAAFMQLWNGAVEDNIIALDVYLQNEDRMEAIDAYFEITGSTHKELNNGGFLDILTIEVEER